MASLGGIGRREVAGALGAVAFVPLLVAGVRLGAALDYAGASMWWVVVASAALGALAWTRRGDVVAGVPLSVCAAVALLLAAALAVLAVGGGAFRHEQARRGVADRIAAAAHRSPGGAAAALRGTPDRDLDAAALRLPQAVQVERVRRSEARAARDRAAERRRADAAERRNRDPFVWLVGFAGWLLHPSH